MAQYKIKNSEIIEILQKQFDTPFDNKKSDCCMALAGAQIIFDYFNFKIIHDVELFVDAKK